MTKLSSSVANKTQGQRAYRAGLSGLTALTVMLGVLVPVSNSSAAVTATNSAGPASAACAPLTILAFRGSGEDPSSIEELPPFERITETLGWEGKILHKVLLSYEGAAEPGLVEKIPVIDIGSATAHGGYAGDPRTVGSGYPSIAVETEWGWAAPTLIQSAETGAQEALGRIVNTLADCPGSKFIALGYSQGAMAARTTMSTFPDVFVGSLLVGDPYQIGNVDGATGTGAAGTGVIRSVLGLYGTGVDNFYKTNHYKSSICHSGDGMCDFDLFDFARFASRGSKEHGSYFDVFGPAATTEAEAEYTSKGLELATLARRFSGQTAPALARPLDILVTVDNGSGQRARQELSLAVADLVALSQERGGDVRVSMVEYGYDTGGSSRWDNVLLPTFDISKLAPALDAVVQNKTASWFQYTAIFENLNSATHFRPGADRAILNVSSDERPYDFCWGSNCYEDQLEEAASVDQPSIIAANGASVAGGRTRIYDGEGDTQSGGKDYFFPWDYRNHADGTDSYQDVFRDIFNVPTAAMGLPAFAIAGSPVVIGNLSENSASASLTVDGSETEIGRSGTVTFPTSGTGQIALTAEDDSGRTSTVKAPITVIDLNDIVTPLDPGVTPVVSDARADWIGVVQPGQELSVTASTAEGGQIGARSASLLGPEANRFYAADAIDLGRSTNRDSEGFATVDFVVPGSYLPGEYVVLVLESDGSVAQLPMTVGEASAGQALTARAEWDAGVIAGEQVTYRSMTAGEGGVNAIMVPYETGDGDPWTIAGTQLAPPSTILADGYTDVSFSMPKGTLPGNYLILSSEVGGARVQVPVHIISKTQPSTGTWEGGGYSYAYSHPRTLDLNMNMRASGRFRVTLAEPAPDGANYWDVGETIVTGTSKIMPAGELGRMTLDIPEGTPAGRYFVLLRNTNGYQSVSVVNLI